MTPRLRHWKATIAVWFAAIAVAVAPSVVRAHAVDASWAWSELAAPMAAPALHAPSLRRADASARSPRHAEPSFAVLPASRVLHARIALAVRSALAPVDRAAATAIARGYDATAPPAGLT